MDTNDLVTKKDLEQYRDLKTKSENTYKEWQKLEAKKTSLGGTSDGMPRSPSNKASFEGVITEIDEIAQRFYDEYLEELKVLGKIERVVNNQKEPLHSNILYLRYISDCDGEWATVAKKLHFEKRQVQRIHDELFETFLMTS